MCVTSVAKCRCCKEHPAAANALLGLPCVRGRILMKKKEPDGSVSFLLEDSAPSWCKTRGVVWGLCQLCSDGWYHPIVWNGGRQSSILLPVCHLVCVFRCNTWSPWPPFPIIMGMWTGLIDIYEKLQKKFAMKLIQSGFYSFNSYSISWLLVRLQCSHDIAWYFCLVHSAFVLSCVGSLCQQSGNILHWLPLIGTAWYYAIHLSCI